MLRVISKNLYSIKKKKSSNSQENFTQPLMSDSACKSVKGQFRILVLCISKSLNKQEASFPKDLPNYANIMDGFAEIKLW